VTKSYISSISAVILTPYISH